MLVPFWVGWLVWWLAAQQIPDRIRILPYRRQVRGQLSGNLVHLGLAGDLFGVRGAGLGRRFGAAHLPRLKPSDHT
jgi:hypothetical protein